MAEPRQPFSARILAYISAVAICGAVAVGFSFVQLFQQVPEYRSQWLSLVALTVVSGLLPVSLPTVSVSISISETFVIAGTLLFGKSGGTALVLIDALFISVYLFWKLKLRWQQLLFNLACPPLSIWIAAELARVQPTFKTTPSFDVSFIVKLAIFTTLYFLLNSWMVTIAVALQQRVRATTIWWKHFREVLLNYTAGGSIAALLVYNTREVKPEFVFAIIPLLIVLFLTYQWSNKRVEAERQRNAELNRVFLSTIEALALAIDAKDQVTHGHIRRVQRYTIALAEALGVKDPKQLDAIRAAALLHDTGKLAVPEYILNKPGPLTSSEFERMKVHATVGADILKSIDFPYPVEPIVRHHHENWNGTGYPGGLREQQIPLGARILSVVDCYDALTSDRPYRPRYTREHAEQVLRERRGSWYDPWIVDEFLRILDRLERLDSDESHVEGAEPALARTTPKELDVIAATTAEEREFNELRRELPLAATLSAAADILFRHVRRVVPAGTIALFGPSSDASEIRAVACTGQGASTLEDLHIPVGERISGWAFAHRQVVMNSNAALELGPVVRTFAVPLRYAIAVPVVSGPRREPIGVLACYGSEPFTGDHQRVLESAMTLFGASAASWNTAKATPASQDRETRDSRVH